MTVIDPLGKARIVGGVPEYSEYNLIDVLLDDSPTSLVSDVVAIPGGDFTMQVVMTAAATLAPTSVEFQPAISFDGTDFFVLRSDDLKATVVALASMPYTAVVKERIQAPYFRMTVVGVGTNGTNKITVHVGLVPVAP